MTAERDITFRLRVRDESGEGFASLKSKAEATGPAMEGVVSRDLGNRLNHFNATGQKAAAILGQVGGSAGQAAGQVTRFGGVISSLVGRTSMLEAGVLAVGVAVVALGAKLYDMTYGALNAAEEKIGDTLKKTKDLITTIREGIQEREYTRLGITDVEKERLKLLEQRSTLQVQLTRLEQEALQVEQESGEFWYGARFTMSEARKEEILLGNESVRLARAKLVEENELLGKLEEEIRAQKELALAEESPSTISAEKPKKERTRARDYDLGFEKWEDWEAESAYQYQLAEDLRMDAIEREQMQEENRAAILSVMDRMLWEQRFGTATEYYDKVEKKAQDQFELEQKLNKERIEEEEKSRAAMSSTIDKVGTMGANLVGLYEKIAVATSKNEKEASKQRAVAAALLAVLKVGEEGAKAASSLADQDYLGFALHLIAAATWVAQAATANQQGGGGGAAAVAAPSPGPTDRQYWQERKESGEAGGISLHIHGDVISGHQAGQLIEDLLKELERKRNPTSPRSELEV